MKKIKSQFDDAGLRRVLADPQVAAVIEKAYRRGFHQSAFVAARDAARGYDLKAWVIACERWRHARAYSIFIWAGIGYPPPEPWEVKAK